MVELIDRSENYIKENIEDLMGISFKNVIHTWMFFQRQQSF